MAVDQQNDVASKSHSYLEMEQLWALPDDLLGGTLRMREKGATYITQHEAEEQGDYDSLVDSAVLFGGYEKTLDDLTAKPFERPLSVNGADELSEFLGMLESDVDRTGKSLGTFAKELFREALHRGVTHVLVDFPKVPEGATLFDRRRIKARPVLIHVQAPRLLGVQTTFAEDGSEVLAQARIWEEATVPNGLYGEKVVQRVRVFTRETWEIHERVATETHPLTVVNSSGPESNPGPDLDEHPIAAGGYALIEQGTHSFGEVPLVSLYFKQSGPYQGRPVFEAVGHLNLAHYQSSARQRSFLDFARVGTVALFGFTEEDMATGITWGANRYIRTEKGPRDAEVKTVEHGGQAIAAGREDLDELKEEMQALGSAPLIKRSTTITATGEAREEGQGMSQAQSWVRELEKALVQCFEFAAKWLGEELPEKFGVDVFSDFGITTRSEKESDFLIGLCESGKLTVKTLLKELKRRGLFGEAFEVQEELDAIDEEGPALPDPAPGAEPPDPDPEPEDEPEPDPEPEPDDGLDAE